MEGGPLVEDVRLPAVAASSVSVFPRVARRSTGARLGRRALNNGSLTCRPIGWISTQAAATKGPGRKDHRTQRGTKTRRTKTQTRTPRPERATGRERRSRAHRRPRGARRQGEAERSADRQATPRAACAARRGNARATEAHGPRAAGSHWFPPGTLASYEKRRARRPPQKKEEVMTR